MAPGRRHKKKASSHVLVGMASTRAITSQDAVHGQRPGAACCSVLALRARPSAAVRNACLCAHPPHVRYVQTAHAQRMQLGVSGVGAGLTCWQLAGAVLCTVMGTVCGRVAGVVEAAVSSAGKVMQDIWKVPVMLQGGVSHSLELSWLPDASCPSL